MTSTSDSTATSVIATPGETSVSPADLDLEIETDCPVCLDGFKPPGPVYQCPNGHLICFKCESRCQQCPVCRDGMPSKKIRNLVFEKLLKLASLSLESFEEVPCPYRADGCTAMLKKKDVDSHKLDCAAKRKQLCSQLKLQCDIGTTSFLTMDELIGHLRFDHNLEGSGSFGDDFFKSLGILSTNTNLELIQSCKKERLGQYLLQNWTYPNFIKFEDRLFLVKKRINFSEQFASLMVCVDGSVNTAKMYSAVVQLFPGDSVAPVAPFEFKQPEVYLLSTDFTSAESQRFRFCKIPFSKIETCGKLEARDNNENENLYWKVVVSILKKPGSAAPSKLTSNSKSQATSISEIFTELLKTADSQTTTAISDTSSVSCPQAQQTYQNCGSVKTTFLAKRWISDSSQSQSAASASTCSGKNKNKSGAPSYSLALKKGNEGHNLTPKIKNLSTVNFAASRQSTTHSEVELIQCSTCTLLNPKQNAVCECCESPLRDQQWQQVRSGPK